MSKLRTAADLLYLREQIESEIDRSYEELDNIQNKIWPRPKTKNNWELSQKRFHVAILDADPHDKCLTVLNFNYTDHKGKMVRSWYEEVYSGPEDERLWQRVHRNNSKLSEQGPLEQLAWLEGWRVHINVDSSKETLVRKHLSISKRIREVRQRGWPIYEWLHNIVKQIKNESAVPKDCEYYRVYLGNNIIGCLIKDQLHFEDMGADIRVPLEVTLKNATYFENKLKRKRDLRNANLQHIELHEIQY